jgi:hypothetical protein
MIAEILSNFDKKNKVDVAVYSYSVKNFQSIYSHDYFKIIIERNMKMNY